MCESFRGRECQDFVLGGRVAVTLQVDTTSPRNACCSGQSASGPWVASPVGTWCPASPRPCLPRAASSLICGCRGSRRHLLGPKGLSFFEESFLKVVSWRFRGQCLSGAFPGVGFVLGVPHPRSLCRRPSERETGPPGASGCGLGCRLQVWWGGASPDGARPQACTVARELPSALGTQNPKRDGRCERTKTDAAGDHSVPVATAPRGWPDRGRAGSGSAARTAPRRARHAGTRRRARSTSPQRAGPSAGKLVSRALSRGTFGGTGAA